MPAASMNNPSFAFRRLRACGRPPGASGPSRRQDRPFCPYRSAFASFRIRRPSGPGFRRHAAGRSILPSVLSFIPSFQASGRSLAPRENKRSFVCPWRGRRGRLEKAPKTGK
jgi:hypothetical protein